MKLVISASVLSAMVFYSSLLPFLHSLNLYISATTTIHKNYMFLLCNGLLVFIVRNSGLIGNSGDEQSGGNGRGAEALEAAMADGSSKIERKVEIGEERENGLIAKEEEIERLNTENEDEDQEDQEEQEQEQEHEHEEEEEEERFNFDDDEEEEEIGELSNEELNKKCEEFIRKMKAGIKFESQQQVLVL